MAYKGKYLPSYPRKYKGDYRNIIYRSLWERKFMRYCDLNENVLQWGSEEICLPYRSPIDNKIHRYFPNIFGVNSRCHQHGPFKGPAYIGAFRESLIRPGPQENRFP